MVTIIAGGRELTDPDIIPAAVAASGFAVTRLVCGMAPGVDMLAYAWATMYGIPITERPADWTTHGHAAGPIRNRAMARIADALIAIPGRGPGTWNMIGAAKSNGLTVFVYKIASARGR